MVNEFGGTLFTIAKDVKLQIEFNPAYVKGYRLIGYENRMLAKEDFNNDKKDAGDMGSGHCVTALYEIIPANAAAPELDSIKVDALKYQQQENVSYKSKAADNELMNIKLRYKAPDGDVSKLIEHPLINKAVDFDNTSNNFRFAAAVAAYGMLLRNSAYIGKINYTRIRKIAGNALGDDVLGYRKDFLQLLKKTMALVNGVKDDEDESEE